MPDTAESPPGGPSSLPPGIAVETVGLPVAGEWYVHEDAGVGGPVVLHVYGSTFLMNRGPMHHRLAAEIAAQTRGRVFQFDYSLAPERPFPLAIEDVVRVVRSLYADGLSPGRMVIFAEGSGAAIALAALLLLRDGNTPLPAGLALLCPWADLTFSGGSFTRSLAADGFVTDFELLAELSMDYLQGADPHHPLASPALADLAGLPETIIHTAATDPCCDDGALIARGIREGGGRAHLHHWDAMPYTWHKRHPVEGQTKAALASIAQFVRRATRQQAARDAAAKRDLEAAYREGVARFVEPHMEPRIDAIFEWAREQGPSWIWPMIARRVEGGALVTQEQVEREWLRALFDREPVPMFVMSASRHVILANRRGAEFLEAPGPLALSGGRLVASAGPGSTEDAALDKVMAGLFAPAGETDDRGSRTAACRLDRAGATCIVQCHRLHAPDDDAAAPPVVLARIVTATTPQPDPAILRMSYGLSEREADLAAAFAGGTTLEDYRAANGLSMATVRTHFARLKSKLGARDQADVVRLCLTAAWLSAPRDT